MRLLGYQEFLLERRENEWNSLSIEKLQISILEEIAKTHTDTKEFIDFVISENLSIDFFQDSVSENLIDKWKDKFSSVVQKAKESGKEALSAAEEKIVKIGANIGSVIKLIVTKVKAALTEVWNQIKNAANGAAKEAAPELEKKVEGMSSEKKNQLAKEIKDFKTMSSAGVKWALGGFFKEMEGAAVKATKDETNESFDPFLEDLEKSLYAATLESLQEGSLDLQLIIEGGDHGHDDGPKIPFLSAIAGKLGKFPPFSYLHDVQHKAQEMAKKGLDKLSLYLNEFAGAPGPFEFVVLSYLIGVAAELMVKGFAKDAILNMVPGIGTLIYILKYTALGLTVIGVVESLLKKNEEA